MRTKDTECGILCEVENLRHNCGSPRKATWHQPTLAVHSISHLVFVLEGPYVIETRGREERRGVTEQLTAGPYRKKHLQHTPDGERKRERKDEEYLA